MKTLKLSDMSTNPLLLKPGQYIGSNFFGEKPQTANCPLTICNNYFKMMNKRFWLIGWQLQRILFEHFDWSRYHEESQFLNISEHFWIFFFRRHLSIPVKQIASDWKEMMCDEPEGLRGWWKDLRHYQCFLISSEEYLQIVDLLLLKHC